jgi:hypothetical protein
LVEVEFLGIITVWCLDDQVVSENVEISCACHGSLDVEVSFYVQAEVFVEFTFLWLFLVLINIDDIPFLMDLSTWLVDDDVSVLTVNTSLDIDSIALLIDDVFSNELEHLEPSAVG